MNLLCSRSFSLPFHLIWTDNQSMLPQSHLPTMLLLLISDFPCSYFCISWHWPLPICLASFLPSQVCCFLKTQELCCSDCYLENIHPHSPLGCLQPRVHFIVLNSLIAWWIQSVSHWSYGFMWGFGLISSIITFFSESHPSAQLNPLSFPFQSGGKVFLSFSKCLLYMQKCMSAFCLQ